MANPLMKLVDKVATEEKVLRADEIMTVNGTLELTAYLGIVLALSAGIVWTRFTAGHVDMVYFLTFGGLIGALISVLLIYLTRAIFFIPVYAICEGLVLGGISAIFENSYPGIVSQALAGTFAALFSMLILYKTKTIRCTQKFKAIIFISTLSIAGIYLIDFIGSLFGYTVPIISSTTNNGIVFSAVVVVIAALCLIVDFDYIEKGAENLYPKKAEWFGAYGLIVSLVWIYIEILRLLAKSRER